MYMVDQHMLGVRLHTVPDLVISWQSPHDRKTILYAIPVNHVEVVDGSTIMFPSL